MGPETCEQFFQANLEEAFWAWDANNFEDFAIYYMIAFMWLVEGSSEDMIFCPACDRDTPSVQGGMFVHCKNCNTSHIGQWLDGDDIIW